MAKYVDVYLLVAPKKNLKTYRSIASKAGRIYRKYGALEYFECVGDDLHPKHVTIPFQKMVRAKRGEIVIFSFVVYKSRAHRDAVNAKVMKDPYMDPKNWKDAPMPFDMKRMGYGGFKVIVEA